MNEAAYTIRIKGTNPENIRQIAGLMQFAVDNISNEDLIKVLGAIKKNPKTVKKVLPYL